MRYLICATSLFLLGACMGGGDSATSTMNEPATTTSNASGSGTQASPSTPTSTTPTATVPAPAAPNNFASLLNGARAGVGAGAVSYDARLGSAALAHAEDMRANNYFSHTGRNGSTPGDRIRAAGYNWRTYGENIARGQQTEEEVFQAWQNSDGHRRNNLNPNFEDFGLAKAGSGSNKYWVLLLATEQ